LPAGMHLRAICQWGRSSVLLLCCLAGLHVSRATVEDLDEQPCSEAGGGRGLNTLGTPCSPSAPGEGRLRDQMLARFRSHFDDADKGLFTSPHQTKDGDQKIMMSKEDFFCGGRRSPEYYIEYIVEGARPVDVFNVMSDILAQPEWLCKGCTLNLIKNDWQEQVQGLANTYLAYPVNRREFYMWQAYDANFTSNEFLLGTAAKGNEILHHMKMPEHDATVGRMCYSFSRIRPHPRGSRVVQMSLFDARVPFNFGPFAPRHVYHWIWPIMLRRVPFILERALWQANRNWSATRLFIPNVFLGLPGGNSTDPEFSARLGVNSTGGYLEDPLAARRLPWLIAALVIAVVFFCSVLCGSLFFFGACTPSCCPSRKTGAQPGTWKPLDCEGQSECSNSQDGEEE